MKYFILFTLIIFLIIIYIIYVSGSKKFNNENYNNIEKFYNYEKFQKYKKCNYDHLILNKKQLSTTKELFLEFEKFTKNNNIPYFVIGGTLIGTIRNGGLLPFDDDIDVSILQKYVPIIENYKNNTYFFEKMKFPYNFGYKFKKKNSNIFIDIMIFEESNNNYKIINNLWPNATIKKDEIFPLVLKKYSNLSVYVPFKYIQYLNRSHPKWDTEIRFDCGHHTKKCFYKELKLPRTIDINYDNSKFLCYNDL